MRSEEGLLNLYGFHNHWLDGAIHAVGGGSGDLQHNLLGCWIGDLTEDGVAVVQVWSWHNGDKELGAVGTWASVCHGQQEWAVELQLWVELVSKAVAWAAHAGAGWVAALDHEAVDHAVENHAVVEGAGSFTGSVLLGVLLGALGQAHKVFHSVWGVVAKELDGDVAVIGVQNCSRSFHAHHHRQTRYAVGEQNFFTVQEAIMNPVALRTAYTVGKKAYASYAEYRDRKAREAYEALREIGQEATEAAQDARKHVEKRVEQHVSPKPSAFRRVATATGVFAVLAAVAGGVYYFFFRKEAVDTEPPVVEEYEDDEAQEAESVLVYSTQTPTEGVPERDEELLNALEEQLKDLDSEDKK